MLAYLRDELLVCYRLVVRKYRKSNAIATRRQMKSVASYDTLSAFA